MAPPDGGAGLPVNALRPSRGSSPSNLSTSLSDLDTVFAGVTMFSQAGPESPISLNPFTLFGGLFGLFGGGGSDGPKPYQLRYGRHDIYPTLGISKDNTPDQKKAKCKCPTAPPLPDGHTVDENIGETQHAWPFRRAWWANKVRPHGDWDYKRYPGGWKQWDYAGNFNYGATGRACGLTDSELVGAGAELQQLNGTYDNGRNSKAWEIRRGERYYNCGCYRH
jgi:hypothetical protein